MIDFEKLLEPYSEGGRTVEAQIKWLSKKGFSGTVIDTAMSEVYLELSRGKKFKNGHELDRYLLKKAIIESKKEMEVRIKHMQDRLNELVNRHQKVNKLKKIWFVLRGKL